MGTGDRLVIAEAPGEEESIIGEPLVGGSGRWFDSMCRSAGIKRETLSLANCINCRPLNNVFPTDPEAKKYISLEDGKRAVEHCYRAHVEPLLKSHPWKRVDILGDKALRLLTGKEGGITQWRGSPLPVIGMGPKPLAIATFHPSYLMRDQEQLIVAINDLKKPLEQPPEHYNLYPSLEDVKNFKYKEFALDIETRGWTKDITMVGLCAKPTFVVVVPFQGAYIQELKRIILQAETIITQNGIQFDLPILFKALEIEWTV